MAVFQRKYATATAAATDIYIPIVKADSANFAVSADWTPVAGDVKVTKDGGAPANIGTLPTYTVNLGWRFVFTDVELTCKQLTVLITDSATKAVEDQFFIIETSAMLPSMEGYMEGGVYLDANATANTGSILGVDGTVNRPVTTIAAALTLAAQVQNTIILSGSFLSVTENLSNMVVIGKDNAARLDGHLTTGMNISAAKLKGITFGGKFIASSATIYEDCILYGDSSSITGGSGWQGRAYNCEFSTDFHIAESGFFFIYDGKAASIESPIDFIFAGDANFTEVFINGWSGHAEFKSAVNANTSIDVVAGPEAIVTLNSGITAAIVTLKGCQIIDNSSATTITVIDAVERYINNYVYVNQGAANTRTIFGVDGTITKPVSTIAAGKTLADQLGRRMIVKGEHTGVTSNLSGYVIKGWGGAPSLIGSACNLDAALLERIKLKGSFTMTTQTYLFDCQVGEVFTTISGVNGVHTNCTYEGNITMVSGCQSLWKQVTISIFDTIVSFSNSEGNNLIIAGIKGGEIQFAAWNSDNYPGVKISSDAGATIRLLGSCSDGGIVLKGNGYFINESTIPLSNIDVLEWKDIYHQQLEEYFGTIWFENTGVSNGSQVGLVGLPSNRCGVESDVYDMLAETKFKKVNILDYYFKVNQVNLEVLYESDSGSGTVGLVGTISIQGCRFRNLDIYLEGSGGFFVGDSRVIIEDCRIFDAFTNAFGEWINCTIDGNNTLSIASGQQLEFKDCHNQYPVPYVVTCAASGGFRTKNWAGKLTLASITGTFTAAIHMLGGELTLNASCTAGTIKISGWGVLTDSSAGSTVDVSAFQPIPIAGGGGSSDWTIGEKNQIRHRLNIDGTQAAPTTGGAAKMAGTDAALTLKSLSILQTDSNLPAMKLRGLGSGKDIDANEIDQILLDTNELQVDWVNAGRLDLILDSIKNDSGTLLPASIAANLVAIQNIQNNTRFSSSPPTPILVPETGDLIFKISCTLFDTNGNPENPDVQDGAPQIAILARAVNTATNKTSFYNNEAGSTPAIASVAYATYLKMVNVSTGLFEIYYKLPDTELVDTWVITYRYRENSVEFIQERALSIMSSSTLSVVTLADNVTNKGIIQEGTDQSLDAANIAMSVPNVETGSIRNWVQFIASIMKAQKIEIDTLQTILKENKIDVYGTRSITTSPTEVTLGEVT